MDFVSRAKLQQIIWCALCGSRNSFMVVKFNFLRFSIKLCNRRKRAQRLIKRTGSIFVKGRKEYGKCSQRNCSTSLFTVFTDDCRYSSNRKLHNTCKSE